MAEAANRDKLQDWLQETAEFGPDCEVMSLQPLSGGQSSEMFRLECTIDGSNEPEAFVVRLEQRGKQLFKEPDIAREFHVMRGVSLQGTAPVPEMIALEPEGSVLGVPFLVMRYIEGRAPLGRPSMHVEGLLTEWTPQQRHRAACNGLEAMAGVHAVDWERDLRFLLDGAESSSAGIDHHLQRLADWYRWATQGRPYPITDKALAYLQQERCNLRGGADVLLWGDARPGNTLFAPDQSVAALVDWEGALIGPRGLDLGYWLMMERFHSGMIGIEPLPGWPDEREIVSHYEEAAGVRAHDLEYFIVMGAFFISTTLIRGAVIGIEQGRFSPDTGFGHENTTNQIIAELLGLPVPPLSDDFIAHRSLAPGTLGAASAR